MLEEILQEFLALWGYVLEPDTIAFLLFLTTACIALFVALFAAGWLWFTVEDLLKKLGIIEDQEED